MQVIDFVNERNFKEHSSSSQNDDELYNPELPSEDNDPETDVLQEQNHKDIQDVSQQSRSRSNSPVPPNQARRHSSSPENKQSKYLL